MVAAFRSKTRRARTLEYGSRSGLAAQAVNAREWFTAWLRYLRRSTLNGVRHLRNEPRAARWRIRQLGAWGMSWLRYLRRSSLNGLRHMRTASALLLRGALHPTRMQMLTAATAMVAVVFAIRLFLATDETRTPSYLGGAFSAQESEAGATYISLDPDALGQNGSDRTTAAGGRDGSGPSPIFGISEDGVFFTFTDPSDPSPGSSPPAPGSSPEPPPTPEPSPEPTPTPEPSPSEPTPTPEPSPEPPGPPDPPGPPSPPPGPP